MHEVAQREPLGGPLPDEDEAAVLSVWRDCLAIDHEAPWPGPRPLGPDDPPPWLCGRSDDVRRFRREVDDHRLVFLSGLSGVGKTSILRQGLVPGLEASGYWVVECRDWAGSAQETDAMSFLDGRLRRYLLDEYLPRRDDVSPSVADEWFPTGENVLVQLDARLGRRVVLVLDQFEEVLRDADAFVDDLFRRLAWINKNLPMRVVISLRSEHLHELRELERQAMPLSVSHFHLEEVDPRFADEVVRSYQRLDGRDVFAPSSEDEAVAAIVAEYTKAVSNVSRRSARRPGLLHLQAMLYRLYWASRAAGTVLTYEFVDEQLKKFRSQAAKEPAGAGSAAGAARVFELALEESVDVKLERCRGSSRSVGLDDYLIEGTTTALTRMVRHLSSAGFKVDIAVRDLVEHAIGPELASLTRGIASCVPAVSDAQLNSADDEQDGPLDAGQFEALLDVLVAAVTRGDSAELVPAPESAAVSAPDLISSSRQLLSELADQRFADVHGNTATRPWVERLHEGTPEEGFHQDCDRADVTSGAMLGVSPAAVMIEELRRFALALEWLRASDLARLRNPSRGDVRVSLIHDRFGEALDRWSERYAGKPAEAVYALTAPKGADFDWDVRGNELESHGELDGQGRDGGRIIANARWRGAWIRGHFRNVVFANCDLRGSVFDDCAFEGVSFVNCLLDGVMFSDCEIVGRASPAPETYSVYAPRFRLGGSAELAATISRYRPIRHAGPSAKSIHLLSRLSGNPATPQADSAPRPTDDQRDHPEWDLSVEPGSLAIYGGRISSLTVRNLRFRPLSDSGDGALPVSLSLRHTGGSGFDVVEHESPGRFAFEGVALRHVTFSSPPGPGAVCSGLRIEVADSALFQTWIGHDLFGTCECRNSVLVHFWNGSVGGRMDDGAERRMEARMSDGTRYHGIVNVEVADGDGSNACEPLGSTAESTWSLDEVDPIGDVDGDGDVERELTNWANVMDYRREAEVEPSEWDDHLEGAQP